MSKSPAVVPNPKQARAEPTVQALVDATIDMLEERGEAGLRIDELLEVTGVSRGSLYHHFGGREGLIDAAMVVQFGRLVSTDLDRLDSALLAAATPEEMLENLRAVTTEVQQPERAIGRLRRAAIIGTSATRPRLAAALADEQQRLTDRFEELVTELQRRGWVRDDLDPRAIAVFVQAFTIGQMLTEIDNKPVPTDRWLEVVSTVIFDALITPAAR
jgi:AcrR family transcriptional regulator